MSGFQIWPQNSNRTTFHPLLAKKLSKIGKIPDYANFRQFLGQKRVKCYSIWILRPDLESSHHLASFRTQFDIIFGCWSFDQYVISANYIIVYTFKNQNFWQTFWIVAIDVHSHQNTTRVTFNKKMINDDMPYQLLHNLFSYAFGFTFLNRLKKSIAWFDSD